MRTEVIAGTISTTLFAVGNIPMLMKASRTRSLASYSRTHLWMNGTANIFHWFYISALPLGPIWFLHGFHTISTGLMLTWYFRYERRHQSMTRERLRAWLRLSQRLAAQRMVMAILLVAVAMRAASPATGAGRSALALSWLGYARRGTMLNAAANEGIGMADGRGRQGCGHVVLRRVSPCFCSRCLLASRRGRPIRSDSVSSWRRGSRTG